MFNMLKEIQKEFSLSKKNDYLLVNISGNALYVEGQTGIVLLSKEMIIFNVNKKKISVFGKGMSLKILSNFVMCIEGKIEKTEVTD